MAETPRGGFIANMELQPEAPLATKKERQQLKVDEEAFPGSKSDGPTREAQGTTGGKEQN